MRFLLLDTATSACHVGASVNDEVRSSRVIDAPFQHAAMLTPLIEEVLQEAALSFADLSAVGITGGPGSYTGLRIGASVAKGICFGQSLPLIALNTLETMASGFRLAHPHLNSADILVPMIDARRMEVFTGLYSAHGEIIRAPGPLVLDEQSYAEQAGKVCHFFGDGAPKFSSIRPEAGDFDPIFYLGAHSMLPLAKKRFLLGQFESVAYYRPDYHKDFYTPMQK